MMKEIIIYWHQEGGYDAKISITPYILHAFPTVLSVHSDKVILVSSTSRYKIVK